jgi:CBS-domain-containing membrane protein
VGAINQGMVVFPTATIYDALSMFIINRTPLIAVVDFTGKLIGIVTRERQRHYILDQLRKSKTLARLFIKSTPKPI